MAIISRQTLETSPNEELDKLRKRRPSHLRRIAITEDFSPDGNTSMFAKNAEGSYPFTILKVKGEKYVLGKKSDVKQHAQYKFNKFISKILVQIINETFVKNKIHGFSIGFQQLAEYNLDSLIIDEEGNVSYINCLIGIRFFIMEFGKTKKNICIKNILGCIKAKYVFVENNYCFDSIEYIGDNLFEKIVLYAIVPDNKNAEEFITYLHKNINTIKSEKNISSNEINNIAYVYDNNIPAMDTKKLEDILFNRCFKKISQEMSSDKNSKIQNHIVNKLKLINFLIDVLQRLFINYFNPAENKEILLKILEIFDEINLCIEKNHPSPTYLHSIFSPTRDVLTSVLREIISDISSYPLFIRQPKISISHIRPPSSEQVMIARNLARIAYVASLKDDYRYEFYEPAEGKGANRNEPFIVYRGDLRSPSVLANTGGFTTRNPENDIYQRRVFGNSSEIYENLINKNFRVQKDYLCTSTDRNHSVNFACTPSDAGGYLYEMDVRGLHILDMQEVVKKPGFLANFHDYEIVIFQAQQEREVLVRCGIPFGGGHFLRCWHVVHHIETEIDIATFDAHFAH